MDLFASASYGGFAGYNWQTDMGIVGVEILAESNSGSGVFIGVPGPGAANAQLNTSSSLRARFGQAQDNRLSYFFVGLTQAESAVEAVGFSTQTATQRGL